MLSPVLRPQVSAPRMGMKISTFYNHIARAILPPTIKFGPRAVGHFQHEIDAIMSARAAGQTEDQIKALVISQIAARQNA